MKEAVIVRKFKYRAEVEVGNPSATIGLFARLRVANYLSAVSHYYSSIMTLVISSAS
ncbi:hypothetical protein E2C01_087528 [Portunus trituberculatus]|uniref:Uncharacterized protein n=1 Tax=Portunus trituberculatus TaxID=210409 RepID=A0A5B7J6T8_PORTR|nr:hypothetical protein [Portunus trituberculatus]